MLILVWSRNQLPSDALLFELCKSGNWKNLLCCGIIKPEPERIRNDRAAEDENDDVDDEDDIDDNDDDESDVDEVEDADEHVDEADEPPPPPTTPTPPPAPPPTTPPPIFGNKCFNSCMSLIT